MNKKLIIGCLFILILIIGALIFINETYKTDAEIPSINSHLQKGNENYNLAVKSLNNKSYNESIRYCNESYKEFILAKESANKALNKSIRYEYAVQKEYFENTVTEIDLKINSTIALFDGIKSVDSNPKLALSKFAESDKYMQNATKYSEQRIQIEKDNPEKFL